MTRKIHIPDNIEDEWFEVTDPTQFVRTYNALRRREVRLTHAATASTSGLVTECHPTTIGLT